MSRSPASPGKRHRRLRTNTAPVAATTDHRLVMGARRPELRWLLECDQTRALHVEVVSTLRTDRWKCQHQAQSLTANFDRLGRGVEEFKKSPSASSYHEAGTQLPLRHPVLFIRHFSPNIRSIWRQCAEFPSSTKRWVSAQCRVLHCCRSRGKDEGCCSELMLGLVSLVEIGGVAKQKTRLTSMQALATAMSCLFVTGSRICFFLIAEDLHNGRC
jgi:hypothetical protein